MLGLDDLELLCYCVQAQMDRVVALDSDSPAELGVPLAGRRDLQSQISRLAKLKEKLLYGG